MPQRTALACPLHGLEKKSVPAGWKGWLGLAEPEKEQRGLAIEALL